MNLWSPEDFDASRANVVGIADTMQSVFLECLHIL